MSTASMMNVYGRCRATLTIHMLYSGGRVRVRKVNLFSECGLSGAARSTVVIVLPELAANRA